MSNACRHIAPTLAYRKIFTARPDTAADPVKTGLGFTEGPAWAQKVDEVYVLFTDIRGDMVWALASGGRAKVHSGNVGHKGPQGWPSGGI